MEKTVLFYSAGPYGPLGRQLATRAAHELCRNATALHVERSLAQTMAASWRASAGAIVLLGGAGMVAEGSHAGAASSIAPIMCRVSGVDGTASTTQSNSPSFSYDLGLRSCRRAIFTARL